MAADYLCHDCGRTWSGCPRFTADGPLDLIFFEKEGFAPKLNYYVFPKLQTHEKRPQITLMLANARAARRCHSLRSRPASQPLWSCQNYSLNQKATPKRLRSRSERSEDSDALRAEGASALSAVFPHVYCGNLRKQNLRASTPTPP